MTAGVRGKGAKRLGGCLSGRSAGDAADHGLAPLRIVKRR